MADIAKGSLILRRLLATLALAILLASLTACFDQGVAAVLFLPTWAALFFSWQYLGPKLNFNINISKAPRLISKVPRLRPKRPTAWGLIIVTGLVAYGVALGIALFPVTDFSAIAGPLFWIALYYGWPTLSRRLPLPESWKVKAQSEAPSSPPSLVSGAFSDAGRSLCSALSQW